MSNKILVIGAGVSGLSSALLLAQEGYDVTIWAKDLPEQTTSAAAAAFWYPYLCNPRDKAVIWSKAAREYFERLAVDEPTSGVRQVKSIEYFDHVAPEPWWRAAVDEYGDVNPNTLPAGYVYGHWAMMPLVDSSRYLPWLVAKLAEQQVSIVQKSVTAFAEIGDEYEVIVNCTGLGARDLCADDRVYPVRGQVLRVAQQGLIDVVADDEAHNHLAYIIPRYDDIILGGTAQENDWRLEPDPKDTEDILQKTKAIDPTLADIEILQVKVGLRPARDVVRLELEEKDGKKIVHNYGHGGAGYTLSWGCAQDVLALVQKVTSHD